MGTCILALVCYPCDLSTISSACLIFYSSTTLSLLYALYPPAQTSSPTNTLPLPHLTLPVQFYSFTLALPLIFHPCTPPTNHLTNQLTHHLNPNRQPLFPLPNTLPLRPPTYHIFFLFTYYTIPHYRAVDKSNLMYRFWFFRFGYCWRFLGG